MADTRSRALRYYGAGAVRIFHVRTPPGRDRPTEVVAGVQGHHARYLVELAGGRWTCSCQSVMSDGSTCAHAAAVQQCTDPEHSAAAKSAREVAAA